MSQLNVTVGGDINYIFAGNERLFINRSFKEFDLNQFLYSKFNEPINGGKRALISFETNGRSRNISFIGYESDKKNIKKREKLGVLEPKKEYIIKKEKTESKLELDNVREDGLFLGDGGSSEDYEDSTKTNKTDEEGIIENKMIYDDKMVKEFTFPDAIQDISDWVSMYPECVFLIDAELFESLGGQTDYQWMEFLLTSIINRKWKNNVRSEVAIVFKKYSTREEWEDAINQKSRASMDVRPPVLKDLNKNQYVLTIKIPNIDDIRHLVFKRLVIHAPKELYHTDEYSELFNQAISESSVTGCRMLIDVDNTLRTLIGSKDFSIDNLKRLLSIDSIKKKMTWADMLGPINNGTCIHSEFNKIKTDLKEFSEQRRGVDPDEDTFCHRTDRVTKIRSPASQHFRLIGEPGTGKTTLANILAKEYYDMGMIASDRPVIVNLGERISSPNGPGWIATLFDVEGKDRLIFIDEIESMMRSALGDLNSEVRGGNEGIKSMLQLFITKLLSVTTDKTVDTIVCLAGYERGVNAFMELDSGLPSRFPTKFVLDGYSSEVLCDIMEARIEKTYGKKIEWTDEERISIKNMFNRLKLGLHPKDVGSWANARTAETIADIVCKGNNGKKLTCDDFKKVSVQIGTGQYQLSKYIGSDINVLDDLEKITGAKNLTNLFKKIERRLAANIKVNNCYNIALISNEDIRELDQILDLSSKFLSQRNCISSSFYNFFDYAATYSEYQNMPTKMVNRQFDDAIGGILIFESPSEILNANPNVRQYLEQTQQIIRKSSQLPKNSSIFVIENEKKWDDLKKNIPQFTSLFTECKYEADRDGLNVLFKKLEDLNISYTAEFMSRLRESYDPNTKRIVNVNDAIDKILETYTSNNPNERFKLTEEHFKFFIDDKKVMQ